MDEYEGGDYTYAPVNAGPIEPDGIRNVGSIPPTKPSGETTEG
jgi:hypothetical protein